MHRGVRRDGHRRRVLAGGGNFFFFICIYLSLFVDVFARVRLFVNFLLTQFFLSFLCVCEYYETKNSWRARATTTTTTPRRAASNNRTRRRRRRGSHRLPLGQGTRVSYRPVVVGTLVKGKKNTTTPTAGKRRRRERKRIWSAIAKTNGVPCGRT